MLLRSMLDRYDGIMLNARSDVGELAWTSGGIGIRLWTVEMRLKASLGVSSGPGVSLINDRQDLQLRVVTTSSTGIFKGGLAPADTGRRAVAEVPEVARERQR
jgi:hypothetical protein